MDSLHVIKAANAEPVLSSESSDIVKKAKKSVVQPVVKKNGKECSKHLKIKQS